MTKTLQKTEFGDFQTPWGLAGDVCRFLQMAGESPASIIEPTCGKGSILISAARTFPGVDAWGFDVNAAYVSECQQLVADLPQCQVSIEDFFNADWKQLLQAMAEPVLVVGNPPWVTNSALSALGSSNLPQKANQQGFKGVEAITGKSNFDISEWMLMHLLECLDGRRATVALLCKTVVARKALQRAWTAGIQLEHVELRRINAVTHFAAAVDACLLYCRMAPGKAARDCQVYDSLFESNNRCSFGLYNDRLVADLDAYRRRGHLLGDSCYRWRSGIKHDCSKVMELAEGPSGLVNGLGEYIDIEGDFVFPMLKSSELANGKTNDPTRRMLVPQREVGQETSPIREMAPQTWEYLTSHRELLNQRSSSIYRGRPQFSIFGVGGYSFSPWKVAISGFYKSLNFACVGPYRQKPVVLDDTCYSLPCVDEREATFLMALLSSPNSQELYSSLVFWDAKRPITVDLLSSLDLRQVAVELNRTAEFDDFAARNPWTEKSVESRMLFD
jgi:hypothetical protein